MRDQIAELKETTVLCCGVLFFWSAATPVTSTTVNWQLGRLVI
jgi:hypothetical protein